MITKALTDSCASSLNSGSSTNADVKHDGRRSSVGSNDSDDTPVVPKVKKQAQPPPTIGPYAPTLIPTNFPLTASSWQSMLDTFRATLEPDFKCYITHIQGVIPNAQSAADIIPYVYNNTSALVADYTFPRPPANSILGNPDVEVDTKIRMIQSYLGKLGYNHVLPLTYDIKKNISFRRLMNVARSMIVNGLPIKCLEATILSMYLTCSIKTLTRIPLSFKSSCNGHIHRHIVLALRTTDGRGVERWGALGLSRREDLAGKPFKYNTLAELVRDYKEAYEANGHALLKIRMGQPVEHDPQSPDTILWKHLVLRFKDLAWSEVQSRLEAAYRGSIKSVK